MGDLLAYYLSNCTWYPDPKICQVSASKLSASIKSEAVYSPFFKKSQLPHRDVGVDQFCTLYIYLDLLEGLQEELRNLVANELVPDTVTVDVLS